MQGSENTTGKIFLILANQNPELLLLHDCQTWFRLIFPVSDPEVLPQSRTKATQRGAERQPIFLHQNLDYKFRLLLRRVRRQNHRRRLYPLQGLY